MTWKRDEPRPSRRNIAGTNKRITDNMRHESGLSRHITEALRERRIAMGLTQAALSEYAGIAANTIGRIELGMHFSRLPEVIRLATALNMKLVLVPVEQEAREQSETGV